MALFHHDIYNTGRTPPSFWEATAPIPRDAYAPLEGDASCDVAIIGGGFTGLSAALHLARDFGIEARVLEAGHIGWGASGRNGGFCCMPATRLSIAQLIRKFGLEETRHFYRAQVEAVELVARLGEEEDIDYDRTGEGIVDVAHHPSRMRALREEHAALGRVFGIESALIEENAFRQHYFDAAESFGGLHVAVGFGLHPMKFIAGLARAAERRGAVIHGRSPVTGWRKENGTHRLETPCGSVRANRILVAVNGFIQNSLNAAVEAASIPVMSNIIVTRALTDEELARHAWRNASPAVSTRHLHNYFRLLPDRRFLIGARGDFDGSEDAGERMRMKLEAQFRRLFPQWREVPVTHFWRGLVCLTRRLSPCIGRLDHDPSVWFGFGYHGNGVSNAPWAGMMIARNLAGADRDLAGIPRIMRGLSPGIPLGGLRLWPVRAAYAWYRLKDTLS